VGGVVRAVPDACACDRRASVGEFVGRVRFAKLNSDENPETSARFNVRSLPTILVLKGGREVDRIIGLQPKTEIIRRIERASN
jgi:thioredoxin-like negative regulator of GroEL